MSEEEITSQEGTEDLQILTDIKSTCEKINKDLFGLKNNEEDTGAESSGHAGKLTIKELLGGITAQVRKLQMEFKGVDLGGLYKYCPAKIEPYPRKGLGDAAPSWDKIRSENDEAEQAHLLEEIKTVVKGSASLKEGAAIVGRSTELIMKNISNQYALVVLIENHMDVNFQNLEHNIPAGSILDLPEIIESGMSDALVFSSQSQWMTGLLSYCIVEANLRLVIWLQQNTNYLAAALAPMSLQFGNNPFVFEGSGQNSNMWKTSADRRWVTGNSNLILSNRDIVIRINFTCGPKSVIIIQAGSCKVKNIKNEDAFPLYKTSLSAIMDGKTIAGKSIDVISEYFLEDYGYILEFVNFLGVSLSEPACYLENGQQPFTKPNVVSLGSREVLVVKMDNSGKGKGGIVSFRIGNTDLRIAVAFQLFNNGNKFATAFVPSNVPTDGNLMVYLTSDDQWSTSPDRKFAMAKHGPLVILARNICVRVEMTEDLKAVLKIVLKTY